MPVVVQRVGEETNMWGRRNERQEAKEPRKKRATEKGILSGAVERIEKPRPPSGAHLLSPYRPGKVGEVARAQADATRLPPLLALFSLGFLASWRSFRSSPYAGTGT